MKDLGLANHWRETPPELVACVELGHRRLAFRERYFGEFYNNVSSCDKCGIKYSIDSSD